MRYFNISLEVKKQEKVGKKIKVHFMIPGIGGGGGGASHCPLTIVGVVERLSTLETIGRGPPAFFSSSRILFSK